MAHQQLQLPRMSLQTLITAVTSVCLGGMEAFAVGSLMASTAFELTARGYIAEPFKEIASLSQVECAVRCFAMNHVCYGFSLTPMAGSSKFLCKISVGNPAWVEDTKSSLFIVSDKLEIATAGGYSLKQDGRFYKPFSERRTLLNSIRACVAEGATLAPAYTTEQKSILYEFFLPADSPMALGMALEDNSTAKWRTYDGDVFYSSNSSNDPLQTWLYQPTNSTDCVVTSDVALTEWVPKNCFVDQGLYTRVCRRELGYHQRPNRKFYKLRQNCPTHFSDAQALCAAEGGNLASLYTEEDFEAAADIRIQLTTYDYRRAFLGGTDAVTEGIWIMPNGLTYDINQRSAGQLANWDLAEPDDGATGSDDCMALETMTGKLISSECVFWWPDFFICDIEILA